MIEKMDEFAREGLRTLMFCKKDLDDSLGNFDPENLAKI